MKADNLLSELKLPDVIHKTVEFYSVMAPKRSDHSS